MSKGQDMLKLTVAEMNLVFFNGTGSSNFGTQFSCPVVNVNATQIICETADLSLGSYSVFVDNGPGRGRSKYSLSNRVFPPLNHYEVCALEVLC
jgi:hypothetical protein